MRCVRNAFTLLEVMLVVVVIGFVATMVMPRLIRRSPSIEWKNVRDEINNLVYFARQAAITTLIPHRLTFDTRKPNHVIRVEREEFDPENSEKKVFVPASAYYFKPEYRFPEGISMYEVYQGRVELLSENKGVAHCYVVGSGLVQDILLHIIRKQETGEARASLEMEPFFGVFELSDGFKKPSK